MAAGFPIDKQQIDAKVGQVVLNLREACEDARAFKVWLDEQTDEVLLGYGYTEADVTLVRAAVAALDKLARIAVAQETQPAADDFFFHARRLTGLR